MNRILLACALLTAGAAAAADPAWVDDYRYALESLERGQFSTAIDALEETVAAHPAPMLAGDQLTIDYLPYINLAAAYFELGDQAAARKALDQSESYGIATRSYVGRQLWDSYALKIVASDDEVMADAAQSDFRDYDRQALVLSDEEAEEIKRQVLRRCALTGKGPSDGMPWYFHYEYGLELMEAGDAQRAVDQLILAANHREDSKRNSRMYGMWFTNYLPYYQIAQAHSKLGNWRCAMDAMRLSAQYGEFSPVDRGFDQYSDLQKLILRQNEKSG